MQKDKYLKLLTQNVTKHYASAPVGADCEINMEARGIATDRGRGDRMDVLGKAGTFLTLKDHKENFTTAPRCQLINPAETETGIISSFEQCNATPTLICRRTRLR